MQVIKRDGKIVNFDRVKIENAVLKTCYSLEKKFEEKSTFSLNNKIITFAIYTTYLTIQQYVITYPQRFFMGMPCILY